MTDGFESGPPGVYVHESVQPEKQVGETRAVCSHKTVTLLGQL